MCAGGRSGFGTTATFARHSNYVGLAAKARAQGYGILPRPALIWGRQGLSAFGCSLDTQQTVAHIR